MSLLSLFVGCASRPAGTPPLSLIERLLDETLPAAYAGDARVKHKTPWIDVTITGKNLRKEGGHWRWEALTYERNGRFSAGEIVLGSRP
ncbi:MAG TPA: hypothetical protein VLH79_06780 [Chthonomonadales bacterium]|nr:hypothetical protein [Chthonomonadales bacterium]